MSAAGRTTLDRTMAVVLNASNEYLSYATPLNNAANYTWMAWVRFDANNAWQGILSFSAGEGGNQYETLEAQSDQQWGLYDSGNATASGGSYSTGTWYHVAIVRTSSSVLTFYLNGTSTLSTSGTAENLSGIGAMLWGHWSTASDALQGRLSYSRAWTAALSASEIAAERLSTTPVITTNLWGDWPLQSNGNDTSGNGRNLTSNGTISWDTSDEPISAGITGTGGGTLAALTAAGAGTVTSGGGISGSTAATLAAVTASSAGTVTGRVGTLSSTLDAATAAGAGFRSFGTRIVHIESATNSRTSGTSTTVTLAAQPAAGDILIAAHWNELANPTVTPPTGFQLLLQQNYTTLTANLAVFYKVATGSEGTAFAFSSNATSEAAVGISVFRNAAVPTVYAVTTTANSVNNNAPTVDTGSDYAWALHIGGAMYGTTRTGPTNFTELFDRRTGTGSGNCMVALSYREYASPTTTGTQTATLANSDNNVGALVVLPRTSNYGTLSRTLDAATAAGAGTVSGSGGISGSTAATLAAATAAGTGAVAITGAAARTLAAATAASATDVAISGSTAATLGALTVTPPHSIRFYGNAVDQIDRIRIPLEDGASTQYPPNVGASHFTYDFWLRANYADNTTTATDARYANIVADRDDYNAQRGHVVLGVTRRDGVLVACFGQAGSGGTWATLRTTSEIGDGEWHHIAVTRNQTTGQVIIWIDGTNEASGTYDTTDWSIPAGHTNGSGQDNEFLVLGTEKHDVGFGFNGDLDELRISDTVRYSASFTPQRSYAPDANTVGLYHGDTGSGTVYYDSATVAGAPTNGELLVGGTPSGPTWTRLPAGLVTSPPAGSGTLAATLAAATAAGAGAVAITAAAARTLDALTVDGAADLAVNALLTRTLDELLATGAGAVPMSGAGAATLSAVVAASSAAVAVIGVSSVQLDAASGSGTATAPASGTTASTLAALTLSSSGASPIIGAAALSLADATLSSSGASPIIGAATLSLADATLSSSGASPIIGAAALSLADATLSSSGASPIIGAAAATLAALTLQGGTQIQSVGSLSTTLDTLTLSSAAVAPIDGATAATLGAATSAATATVTLVGSAAATLGLLASSATGQHTDIAGSLTRTLDGISSTAAASVALTGVTSATLSAITLASSGSVGAAPGTGLLIATLDALLVSSDAIVQISGSATATLDDATTAAQARAAVTGALAAALDAAVATSLGNLSVVGSATGALDAVSLDAAATTGIVPRFGSLLQTLGDLGGTASAVAPISGGAGIPLAQLAGTASGTISIVGGTTATLDDTTLVGDVTFGVIVYVAVVLHGPSSGISFSGAGTTATVRSSRDR